MKELLLRLLTSGRKNLDFAVLLLRLFVGALMLTHGLAKIESFGTLSTTFPDPLGMGSTLSLILVIFAEAGCSVLLIFGVMTRLAVLPLIFNMCIAAFVAHAGAPFQQKELAVFYLAMYIVILWSGACRYSIDNLIARRLNPGRPAL